MDKVSQALVDYFSETMNHPDVSGFELLELLDVRSKLASREPLFSDEDKARLEMLDRRFLQLADLWLTRISEIADLAEMRKRSHILPSHWWWYLDEIIMSKQKVMA